MLRLPGLSEEQRTLQGYVRELAQEQIAPRAAALDATGDFPWDTVKLFREQGWYRISIPDEFGGSGLPLFDCCLVYQEVANACLTSSITLADQKLGADAIVRGGTQEQKNRFLPQIASGEKLVAFALTEPAAGSDVGGMKMTATPDRGEYVLDGRKCFITNGNVADLFTVFAVTDTSGPRAAISCFVVESGTPGLSVGRVEQKMGVRGSPTTEVVFEGCRLPARNLVGKPGDGFRLAMSAMDPARVVVAFQAIGIAEAALDYALHYVNERTQFGKPILDFQGIQFMLADLQMQLDAARYLSHAAAIAYDSGSTMTTALAAEAKAFASDVAVRVTTDAVQLLGGNGYMRDYPVERMLRDAKVLQIFDGTNQVQRVIIAREMRRRVS